jgi:hypothetical protein
MRIAVELKKTAPRWIVGSLHSGWNVIAVKCYISTVLSAMSTAARMPGRTTPENVNGVARSSNQKRITRYAVMMTVIWHFTDSKPKPRSVQHEKI